MKESTLARLSSIPDVLHPDFLPTSRVQLPLQSIYDSSVSEHCRFELIVDCDEDFSINVDTVAITSPFGKRPRVIVATALELKDMRSTKFLIKNLGLELDVRFTEYNERGAELYSWSGRYQLVAACPTLSQGFSAWKFVLSCDDGSLDTTGCA